MAEEILKAIPVFLSSMFKFILGPVGGFVVGLHPTTTVLATVGGMMTSVTVFTFLGSWLKPKIAILFTRRKKKTFKRRKQLVRIWKKYGEVGIALLTPLLFTPIGGTILMVSLGAPRDKTMLYLLISGLGWAIILTGIIYIFGQNMVNIFM